MHLVSVLTKAVQEQQAIIAEQRSFLSRNAAKKKPRSACAERGHGGFWGCIQRVAYETPRYQLVGMPSTV